MAEKEKFTALISKIQFAQIEKSFRKHYDLALETCSPEGRLIPSHCSDDCLPDFCRIVQKTRPGEKRCMQDRLRCLHMAYETGQPYTSLCHAGIILNCIPLMNRDTPLGGIFLGKCLSESFSPAIREDIEKRLIGLRLSKSDLASSAGRLPVISARRLHEALEFLFIMLYDRTGLDPRVIEWRRQRSLQQAQIGEIIKESKLSNFNGKYPFHSEQDLISKVKIGDKTGAREILNSILGTILFSNPGRMNILKARLVELLGILSRSAAEAGADADTLLEKNAEYITRIISLDTQEEICACISQALHEFIDSVYELQKLNRRSRLSPALDYMRANYRNKISLRAVAKSAHLSSSRLCHLFREQFDFTVFDYVTNLRVNRARQLLIATDKTCIEICYDSGFTNLSYFNRTFKQRTGMTPTQFRKQNCR